MWRSRTDSACLLPTLLRSLQLEATAEKSVQVTKVYNNITTAVIVLGILCKHRRERGFLG
jgi:hypothetical protein